jgi:hypothetical protein
MSYNICEKIVRQNFLEYTDPYTLNKHSMINSKIEIEGRARNVAYSQDDMKSK